MAFIIRCKGSFAGRRDYMKAKKMTFTLKATNNTKYIVTKRQSYKNPEKEANDKIYMYSDQHFPKKYLHLFQKVKKEVLNCVELNYTQKDKAIPDLYKKSLYNQFKDMYGELAKGEIINITDTIELDVTKAYYNTAFVLGFITKGFYDFCIGLPKYMRLALIGSIATKKIIYEYQDGEVEYFFVGSDDEKEQKTIELLRRVWFNIVNYVDNCLFEFSKLAADNFILYWVDGIYLKKYPELNLHFKIITNKYKLNFDEEKTENVQITRYHKDKYEFKIILENGKEKVFKHKNKKHLINFSSPDLKRKDK